ncbi:MULTISPECIES: DoxX family protein [Bradyrhizobium]|uniref:Blr4260 protein n=1 Tax=Bradyrhizobium diazoefficiens (strain JCM 10833 / BCRC 13528 / IAM 13628 / NBRC 14792 / USDA 110) TaxID=224911 RepID=Q89MD3_BRADU|nr:DoxX family protein [Bradyrhizobium diazoefficiens]MBP1065735.1 putative membrane protein YphA (DoxX/SURF4 family) [Bradyrhizobium japonicum]AND89545.1 DoxX family protein [Bradyrhizobium diazoefficiens USDA 110]AWO91193.1 DoxX family protein [Bradyrhizobium diazoefficiens]PDT61203.1 DoxX family protein [Bradyrhizobium diazoefficiens]QBP23026.1 DoxX family protein [Bradyrhizobium diazoefficiens]
MGSKTSPKWISAILRWPLLWHAARLALVSAYILGGFTKLLDLAGAAAEQEHFGLYPGWLWASAAILVELFGSLLVVINRWVWLGAGGLGILTFVAMLTANAFWTMGGHERFMATNAFFEHLGLIAGLVIVTILSEEAVTRPKSGAGSQAIQGVSR